jgi:hypothetical protein
VCCDRYTTCVYPSSSTPTTTRYNHGDSNRIVKTQVPQKRKSDHIQHTNHFERVFLLLQSQPAPVATDMFRRIRLGADVSDLLRYVQYGNLRLQLSLVPDTSYQFTSPYLVDMMPIFQNLDNDYLKSNLYKSLTATTSTIQKHQNIAQQDLGAAYRVPYTGARMYDPRLSSELLRPSNWTAITSDDVLLRSLLEVYFLYEYPFWPCIHKDSFLDDMIAGKGDFCSPLLVNAVLTAACVSH